MNINKQLQSYGIMFPRDCSLKNLKYLVDLGSFPMFEALWSEAET